MSRTRVVFVGFSITLILPFLASAATVAELQAQLQALLAQVAALQTQVASTPTATFCPSLTRNLSRGMKGSDVASLQQFLISQNLLTSDSATGFFGALTESAVKQWQAKNGIASSGTPNTTGYGAVGPRTRVAMAKCTPSTATPATTTKPLVTPGVQCPVFSYSFGCLSGFHAEKKYDLNGCELAPKCVADSVSSIPLVTPSSPQSISTEPVSQGPTAMTGSFDPVTWMSATKGAGVVKMYGEVWDASAQTWKKNGGLANPMKMMADYASEHVYFHKDSSWQDFVGQTYDFDANNVWIRTETMGYFNCTDVNPQTGRCDNYTSSTPWDIRNDKFRLFVGTNTTQAAAHGYLLAPRPVSHGWRGALDVFDTYYCNSFSEVRTSTCTLYQKGNKIFVTVYFYKNYDLFNDAGDRTVALPNGTPQQRLFDVMVVSIEEGLCDASLPAGGARCIARERNFYGRVGNEYWGLIRFDSGLRKQGAYELTERVVAYEWDTSYNPKLDEMKVRAHEVDAARFAPPSTNSTLPSNLVATCGAGSQATFSWSPVSGATSYALRVNDTTNEAAGCSAPSVLGAGGRCAPPTDYVYDLASSPTVLTVPQGKTLEWWVHPVTSSGLGAHSVGTSFSCPTN